MQIPAAFLNRMQATLGDEYPEFERSLHEPAASGLRMNLLKTRAEELRKKLEFELEPVPWCLAGYAILGSGPHSQASSPGKMPEHAAGLYYLQEPSAMVVAEILDAQPGERILDLAAAPGGKSTHIVSLMKNEGLLLANEIHPQRVWELAENLERWGAANTIITQETPARLASWLEGFFDRVLLDAPCSGEGMFRKSENARRDWSPELVASCAVRQKSILREAARLVRPGGMLVYSTCTFSQEENEAVISDHLENNPDFALEEITRVTGALTYLPGTLRLMPHRVMGEGHFVARMRRRAGGPSQPQEAWRPERLPSVVLESYQSFCRDIGMPASPEEQLLLSGSYLYRRVEAMPDLRGLKIIHPGLWLGTIRQGERKHIRFEPAHSLAMAMKPEQVERKVSFDQDEIIHYLKGMPISHPGPDGRVLVCMDRYPIGWGKRVNGVVKNYYPKGLRV